MNDELLHALVGTYNEEIDAEETLDTLIKKTKEGQIDIHDAALIIKDHEGAINVKDTANISTGRGAAIGGVIGGVIGLIAGPAGAVILGGTGAVIGGALTGGDEGIPDERLEKIGESLNPDTSAIVVIVDAVWVGEVESILQETASEVNVKELDSEISSQLLGLDDQEE